MKKPPVVSDQSLVQDFCAGNQKAFESIFNRLHPSVSWKVYHLMVHTDSEDRKDIVQDIFIKLLKLINEGKYDPRYKLSTWATHIVQNHCIDLLRRGLSKSTPSLIDLDAERYPDGGQRWHDYIANNGPSPYDLLTEPSDKEIRKEILAVIKKLPKKKRQLLLLRYYHGLTYTEIAAYEKKSLGSVKTTLHRAHAILKTKLARLRNRSSL